MPADALSRAAATLTERLAVRCRLGAEGGDLEARIWAESCGDRGAYRAGSVRACLQAAAPAAAEQREEQERGGVLRAEEDPMQLRARAFQDMQLVAEGGRADGLVLCRACHSNDVSVEARQTRSADEGMTLFMECNQCGQRWRG